MERERIEVWYDRLGLQIPPPRGAEERVGRRHPEPCGIVAGLEFAALVDWE